MYVRVDSVTSDPRVVRTVRERSVKLSGVATSRGVPASGQPMSQRKSPVIVDDGLVNALGTPSTASVRTW